MKNNQIFIFLGILICTFEIKALEYEGQDFYAKSRFSSAQTPPKRAQENYQPNNPTPDQLKIAAEKAAQLGTLWTTASTVLNYGKGLGSSAIGYGKSALNGLNSNTGRSLIAATVAAGVAHKAGALSWAKKFYNCGK